MGTRSKNYICLMPQIALSSEVTRFLNVDTADIVITPRGTLIAYETNRSPMWAREGKNCARDLEEEMVIQQFLGSLPQGSFYMKRAGGECDYRGTLTDHPFKDHESVKEIDATYAQIVNPEKNDSKQQLIWDQLCDVQGWNDASQISILKDFISNEGLTGELISHADKVADEENAPDDEPEISAVVSRPRM